MIKTSPEKFILNLKQLFNVLDNIEIIISDFHKEMGKGLSGNESSLKMLPSFVNRPKGHEKGKFIALDLGGTNFRVLAVNLDGKGISKILAVSKFKIKKAVMKGPGVQLFDFIALCIDQFLKKNNFDRNVKYSLAFTFSFPIEQTNIASGKLINWTKGFSATGVEGKDVVILLKQALTRRKIKFITVDALVNDTVGTLVSKNYSDQKCDIGVILGTGTNACYPEKLSNIKKIRYKSQTDTMIINIEWGNFDKLKTTKYDRELDKTSLNPSEQIFEKMISGMFLGELTKLIICDMMKMELIFKNNKCCSKLKHSFTTEYMSFIEGDKSKNLNKVIKLLDNAGISNTSIVDRQILKTICNIVSTRAAYLSAAAISAVLLRIDTKLNKKHTIGIDGTLFEKYPDFKGRMIQIFNKLFNQKSKNIELVPVKDGSGIGAAIIAAVVNLKSK